jgi:hypothetical protein
MTAFNIELITEQPDHVYVDIARRFNVVIVRTETGLSIRVYPRTDGDLWDNPFNTFEVAEADIIEREKEMQP